MQFAATRLLLLRRQTGPGSAAATAAVNNYGVLNCQNDIRQWKLARAASGSALLSGKRLEKWRFICRRVIIRTGIHEGHQVFSQKDEAFEGDFRHDPVRLLSPNLLNHHHPSHLPDRWRDLSPVRQACHRRQTAPMRLAVRRRSASCH